MTCPLALALRTPFPSSILNPPWVWRGRGGEHTGRRGRCGLQEASAEGPSGFKSSVRLQPGHSKSCGRLFQKRREAWPS